MISPLDHDGTDIEFALNHNLNIQCHIMYKQCSLYTSLYTKLFMIHSIAEELNLASDRGSSLVIISVFLK